MGWGQGQRGGQKGKPEEGELLLQPSCMVLSGRSCRRFKGQLVVCLLVFALSASLVDVTVHFLQPGGLGGDLTRAETPRSQHRDNSQPFATSDSGDRREGG